MSQRKQAQRAHTEEQMLVEQLRRLGVTADALAEGVLVREPGSLSVLLRDLHLLRDLRGRTDLREPCTTEERLAALTDCADAVRELAGAAPSGGFESLDDCTSRLVERLRFPSGRRPGLVPPVDVPNPVSALQEYLQQAWPHKPLPDYQAEAIGTMHSPSFRVTVKALGKTATGEGPSKTAAKKAAASQLIAQLQGM